MPADFLTNFMSGWQMGLQKRDAARRDQEMRQEIEREAFDRQQRQEALKLQRQEIDLRMKKAKQEDTLRDFELAQAARSRQGMPPPTAEDVGIQQAVPDVGPPVSQINVPQPTMGIPQVSGGPDIQMPLLTGRQQAEEAQAAQQAKMREVLGLERGKLEVQEPFKVADDERTARLASQKDAAAASRAEAAAVRTEQRASSKEAAAKAKEGDFGVAKSEGERKAVAMSQYALEKMPSWQEWVKANSDTFGPVSGNLTKVKQSGMAAALGYKPSKEVAKKQAEFAIMRNNMINALSGAAVSPQEFERLKQQVPELTDPAEVVSAKLEVLADYFKTNLTRFQAKVPATVAPLQGGGTDEEPPDA